MIGKCPKCEKLISSLNGNEVEVSFPAGNAFKAVTYNCPFCFTVIGCQIDPIAIRTDIVRMVTEELKK